MPQGIDIYTKYQTVTDWHAVRGAGYEFAYVKVSDGNVNRDDGGWGPKGRAAGLAMGAYHYAQPGDPVAQANRLCDRAIAAGLTDLAPALDLEAPFARTQSTVDFAVSFVRQVKARGFRPALYANNSMMQTIGGPVKAAVPDAFLWVARYGANPTVPHDLWQHSSTGKVPGISASGVDLDTGAIPFNNATEDDLTPDQANTLKWLERAMRTVLRLLTDDPEGDPAGPDNPAPGFPSFADPTVRLTPLSALQLIDLHLIQTLDKLNAAPATPPSGVEITDEDRAKLVTGILSALPATLAQTVVDEISKRLEGA
jgi:GH25 family lysozyme M1 (1,4-beta-N-acetylmuramidase)